MAELFVTSPCEPCGSCRSEAWQVVVDGRLRWEQQEYCTAEGHAYQACGGGWGPPPPRIRERILAGEGAVRLAVGGPDGVPLAAVRELYGLTLPQLRDARAYGIDATPVEAQWLGRMRDGARG
ncbi:hypothetical protein AB0953_08715 [Streptomyces sp. NPDC046866]|uniref:hypothetical protein n=1 Tax=Streptomyces sp. NPDC046866 TaxID=3154921 RepID=UPI003455AEF0